MNHREFPLSRDLPTLEKKQNPFCDDQIPEDPIEATDQIEQDADEELLEIVDPEWFPEITPPRPYILMLQSVFIQLMMKLTSLRPERGGALLGPKGNDTVVTHFIFDEHGRSRNHSFTLDHVGINKTLTRYVKNGFHCLGFAHSHPGGVTEPSYGDLVYAQRTFNLNGKKASTFLMPIVSGKKLYPWVITRDKTVLAELILV